MSAFEEILVKDDRLGCITLKVKNPVLKGGQNITCQPFKAISETKASRVCNVTVPDPETAVLSQVVQLDNTDGCKQAQGMQIRSEIAGTIQKGPLGWPGGWRGRHCQLRC